MDNIKLKELFRQNADRQEAEKMAAYMRGKFAYFGVPTPKRKMLTKQFFEGLQKTALIGILSLIS